MLCLQLGFEDSKLPFSGQGMAWVVWPKMSLSTGLERVNGDGGAPECSFLILPRGMMLVYQAANLHYRE